MMKPEFQLAENPFPLYQIKVKGALHEKWSDWFGGLEIKTERSPDGSDLTVLQGSIQDRAALRGILVKLLDLNLVLISVQQIQATPEEKKSAGK
jgi:hypothetical protein